MSRNLILSILLFAWCFPSMGATIRVCEQCEVKTIEGALLQAGRGDSVVVAAGIYECKAINITRPVSLIGEKGAVLDGGGINYAVKILCDSVTLSGFTVQTMRLFIHIVRHISLSATTKSSAPFLAFYSKNQVMEWSATIE
jgi:nitrous oxidase accessory protein NosD